MKFQDYVCGNCGKEKTVKVDNNILWQNVKCCKKCQEKTKGMELKK